MSAAGLADCLCRSCRCAFTLVAVARCPSCGSGSIVRVLLRDVAERPIQARAVPGILRDLAAANSGPPERRVKLLAPSARERWAAERASKGLGVAVNTLRERA